MTYINEFVTWVGGWLLMVLVAAICAVIAIALGDWLMFLICEIFNLPLPDYLISMLADVANMNPSPFH